MALIVKDRIKETASAPGVGAVTLLGAASGFRSFADIGNGNDTYYCIADQSGNNWEVGLGRWATGNTLTRTTVLSNSLGTTALINFTSGTQDVFVTYPSGKALLGDTSAVTSTGTGSVVLSTAPSIAGGATIDGTTQDINIGTSQTTGALNIGTNTARTSSIYIGNSNEGYALSINNFASGARTFIGLGTASQSYIRIGAEGSESATASELQINGDVTIGDTYIPTQVRGGLSVGQALTAPSATVTNSYLTTASVSGSLIVSGTLSLGGSDTVNQSIATNQTTGSLTIGGTGATSSGGAINIGSGTGGQAISIASSPSNTGSKTINLASGSSTANKTINIGSGTAATTSIVIGSTTATTSTVNINGTVGLVGPTNTISISPTQTTGTINIGGTGATGTINLGRPTTGSSQTINIANTVLASGSTQIINMGASAASGSTTNITIGSTAGTSTTTMQGYFLPPALASAPTYVKGAVYFDTTLNKLRVGGATTWETITSI